jgi:hypothetical protein
MANHLSYAVLSRLVERRSSPADDARAQRHLAGCGRCRSELAWLKRLGSLPQRGGELARSEQSADSVGEEWGSLGRRPAAGGPTDFSRGQPQRPNRIAAYWLRISQSALVN